MLSKTRGYDFGNMKVCHCPFEKSAACPLAGQGGSVGGRFFANLVEERSNQVPPRKLKKGKIWFVNEPISNASWLRGARIAVQAST